MLTRLIDVLEVTVPSYHAALSFSTPECAGTVILGKTGTMRDPATRMGALSTAAGPCPTDPGT